MFYHVAGHCDKEQLSNVRASLFHFFGLRFRPSRSMLLLIAVIISFEFYPRGSQSPISLTSHQVWGPVSALPFSS